MRNEFPKSVRRAALLRARGTCEAMGTVYGLTAATRCHAPLARAVSARYDSAGIPLSLAT
jgi:hypothetical protein